MVLFCFWGNWLGRPSIAGARLFLAFAQIFPQGGGLALVTGQPFRRGAVGGGGPGIGNGGWFRGHRGRIAIARRGSSGLTDGCDCDIRPR